jgi:endonuclease VIII
MPEGPSLVILKEETQRFVNKKVVFAETDGRIDFDVERLNGQTITALKTWGKHFLICFNDFTVRIHLLMFGKYFIDGRKPVTPRLGLRFNDGELNFYTCSVKLLEGDIDKQYDWTADIMGERWDARRAKKKVRAIPSAMICDVLLDQNIFAGLGNIIKNEILYRVRIHPTSQAGAIPDVKLRALIAAARDYSFEFLELKKKGKLKRSWQAHTKKTCHRCDLPMHKAYTGILRRRSFFCDNCQPYYHLATQIR